jgi:hypothetical protein
MMKSIAFWSSTPQQGKTTAARFLMDNLDYVKVSFAGPLRFMIERLLHSAGYTYNEIQWFLNEGKEQNIDVIGASYRKLARTLGTEWGRNLIHPDVWVNIAEQKIIHTEAPICIDDLRFPNELELLRRHDFALVKVVRDVSRSDADSHKSDVSLRDFDSWDHVIENNGTLEELCSKVRDIAWS